MAADNLNNSLLCEILSQFLLPYNLQGEQLALAVSGGSDSMALAIAAKEWADLNNCKIVAITVDHRLRHESSDEAKQVGKWLQKYAIEHKILVWEEDKKLSNIQSTAREARYRLMTEFCSINNIKYLLVAHNMEDVAENILLRIMRGSGVDGLSGIRPEVTANNLTILRPLLNVSKEDLKSFLKQKNQQWAEDPSNNNPRFDRVNARNFIKQAKEPELLVQRLAQTAAHMARSRSYIEQKIAEDIAHVADIKPEGYVILNHTEFNALHEEAGYRILSHLIKITGGDYYKPRFEQLDHLYRKICNEQPLTGSTLGGCEIYPSLKKNEQDKIIICRELNSIEADKKIKSGESQIWDNRFICIIDTKLHGNFTIGALGSDGFAQICNINPDFKKLKLPKSIIYSLPALKTIENIAAVPHISYYAGDDLREKISIEFKI